MKVGDTVLNVCGGTCPSFKKRAKIVRETKLYWIVEFVFKNKDGSISNRCEQKYRKSDLYSINRQQYSWDIIQEVKSENA